MICGIDYGRTGAIALYYSDSDHLDIHDMPHIDKRVNGAALAALFEEFRPDHVMAEQINSFNMGRQSALNFGRGIGVIDGVLAALKIPRTEVQPVKWKRHFHLNKDKGAARAAATRLFPTYAEHFTRVMDHNRAEAALLALYLHQTGDRT